MKNLQANLETLAAQVPFDDLLEFRLLEEVLDFLDARSNKQSAMNIAVLLLGNFDDEISDKLARSEATS